MTRTRSAEAGRNRQNQTVRTGLDGHCYTDPDVLDQERERVFERGWVALCREDEIPSPGSFLATRLHEEPVVVVRGKDSAVRVLSNVCRHRGMLLTEGAGKANRLQCPYHAWTYDLDGSLAGAPLMRDQVKGRNCDLPTFKTWCWGGFVFANPDSSARPPVLGKLDSHIGNYGMADFHLVDVFEEVWACNWKCLVENFMDAYHLSVVHPETLRPLTPSHLSREGVHGKHFTSYTAHYAKAAPLRKHHAPGLTDDQRRQSELFCIYPSMVASVSADTLAFLMLQPETVSTVRVRWGLASYEKTLSQRERRGRVSKWQAVNQEDHAILAKLQSGLSSGVYSPGPLAPPDLEGCVAQFHRWYDSALKR